MAKDVSKLMLVIEDEALWDTMLDHSESRLVVIDLHQEWCGYCDAIHPSISRMFLDYDECETRFLYCSASIGKLGAKIQPFLPTDSHIDLVKNGCLPLFALVRVSIANRAVHSSYLSIKFQLFITYYCQRFQLIVTSILSVFHDGFTRIRCVSASSLEWTPRHYCYKYHRTCPRSPSRSNVCIVEHQSVNRTACYNEYSIILILQQCIYVITCCIAQLSIVERM